MTRRNEESKLNSSAGRDRRKFEVRCHAGDAGHLEVASDSVSVRVGQRIRTKAVVNAPEFYPPAARHESTRSGTTDYRREKVKAKNKARPDSRASLGQSNAARTSHCASANSRKQNSRSRAG